MKKGLADMFRGERLALIALAIAIVAVIGAMTVCDRRDRPVSDSELSSIIDSVETVKARADSLRKVRSDTKSHNERKQKSQKQVKSSKSPKQDNHAPREHLDENVTISK